MVRQTSFLLINGDGFGSGATLQEQPYTVVAPVW